MDKYIKQIREYGHQYNPAIRALFVHYTETDWENLSPSDPDGKALVHSFQQVMGGDLASICAKRGVQYQGGDGIIGPATLDLFQVSRCGLGDYLSPEVLEKTGRGSIPAGCVSDYPHNHVTRIYFDMSGASADVRAWWKDIWAVVKEAYQDIGLLILEVEKVSQANHVLNFASLGGSTIGLAVVGTNWTCDNQVWLRIDKNYYPSAIRVAQVFAHEFAHNTGIGHINGDPIQNASVVNRDWNGSFRNTPLGDLFVSMFGGEPVVVQGTPPTPQPVPPSGKPIVILSGEIQIKNVGITPYVIQPGESSKPFIIVPK